MVTYRCWKCVKLEEVLDISAMASSCTLSYDVEISNEPHMCPFKFGCGGLPKPDWVKVEE